MNHTANTDSTAFHDVTIRNEAGSFAEIALACPNEDVYLLRELLCYDALCRHSCHFMRLPNLRLDYVRCPSPLHWSRQIEWPWVLRHGDYKLTDLCLDVGSAHSVLQYAIARRCNRLIAIDNDPNAAIKTKETSSILGIGNIVSSTMDATAIAFDDNTFDKVSCVSMLEHVGADGWKDVVKECIRVLKPGGIGLFTMDVSDGSNGVPGDFNIDLPKANWVLDHLGIVFNWVGWFQFVKIEGMLLRCLMIKYRKA